MSDRARREAKLMTDGVYARAMGFFAEALQSDVSDIQQGTTAEGVHLGAMAERSIKAKEGRRFVPSQKFYAHVGSDHVLSERCDETGCQ